MRIKYLTIYAMSVDNFSKRSKEEVENLLNIFYKYFSELLNSKEVKENEVRVRFIGFKDKLPEKLRKLLGEIEKKTENFGKFNLTFAICYGGREEIVEAVKKIVERNIKEVNEKVIKENMFSKDLPPLDLVIRTGKERRISNFMLWDLYYSEIYFVDKYFPEFTPEDFEKAIDWFLKRERRFGK